MTATKAAQGGTRSLVACCVLLAAACSSLEPPTPETAPASHPTPTIAPLPPPTPPRPAPLLEGLTRMSGRVLDEFGAPVAGASVSLQYRRGGRESYPPSDCWQATTCSLSAQTDANGEYLIAFDPVEDRRFPGHAGFAYAGLQGYESNVQLVPAGTPAITRNFRLRWSWVISAGESISLSIDADSSRCHDGELFSVLQSRCESIYIKTSSTGTLVIGARATAADGTVPTFHLWDVIGRAPGSAVQTEPGVVSLQVRAGTHRIKFGLPDWLPPQRFEIVTSLR